MVDTTALTPPEVARRIAAALPGPPASARAPHAQPGREPQFYRGGVLAAVVDCADLDRSARFWAQALGYTALATDGRYRSLMPADGSGAEVLLQQVGG